MEKHLRVMIYEPSMDSKEILRNTLVRFSLSEKTEINIDWIKPNASIDTVVRLSIEADIAFVSVLDVELASKLGRCIYENNQKCALVYYGYPDTEIETRPIDFFRHLFPSRPVGFIPEVKEKEFYNTILRLTREKCGQFLFVWENRSIKYRIPYANILYYKSDRNYVRIYLKNGTVFSFLGKLADVEKRIDQTYFIRVHQSYLINKTAIICVDKSKKCAKLFNGEEVYISKAHYKDTLDI